METVTHILSGALIARAIVPSLPQREADFSVKTAVLCGATAAAFPDIDFVAAAFGPLAYLMNHRGITHSVILLPLFAFLIAATFAAMNKKPRQWSSLYRYAGAGLLIHILGDLCNSYGTMIFAPLSDHRFGWGSTFIFDFWLTGIILAGLLLSLRWRNSRYPAQVALVLLVGTIGAQIMLKERAIEVGQDYASANGWSTVSVDALPQALSPFRWMVVVKNGNVYSYTYLNLLRQEAVTDPISESSWLSRFNASYPSAERAVWQKQEQFGFDRQDSLLSRQAFNHPGFAFFRWFAAYPVLYRIERLPNRQCVWFEDLRFRLPGLERPTFRFGMCSSGLEWFAARWTADGIRKLGE